MNKYENWLANIPRIGSRKKIKLVTNLGSAKNVFLANEKVLLNLIEDGKRILTIKNVQNIINEENKNTMENKKNKLEKMGIKLVTFNSVNYPIRLQNIIDPPYQIYYYGELPDDRKPSLAIIGARECTAYGVNIARRIGNALGKHGIEVISGMAKGVDGIAQLACIQTGEKSFSVLGSGVDICYPKENQKLYENLKIKGGILSEYLPGTQPRPCLFPPRNRIISGLSDGVIVVEARVKSGTQITVDMALEQGKDVYVVPGRITDGLSEGCNQLIKQGAGIITSIEEFINEYLEGVDFFDININKNTGRNLSDAEQMVFACIDYYPKSLNELVKELEGKQSITEIMNQLVSLEIKRHILRVTANSYVLIESF